MAHGIAGTERNSTLSSPLILNCIVSVHVDQLLFLSCSFLHFPNTDNFIKGEICVHLLMTTEKDLSLYILTQSFNFFSPFSNAKFLS